MGDLKEFIEAVQQDQSRLDEFQWRRMAGTAALAGTLLTSPFQQAVAQPVAHHHAHRGLPPKHYTEQDIINTIVGEASDQGYKGMLALADAIRNRSKHSYYKNNVLHGAFGRTAEHNKAEPKEVFELAKKAWDESATKDVTGGAYIWLSDSDIQKVNHQKWFKNVESTMTTSGKSGKQTFFRDKAIRTR